MIKKLFITSFTAFALLNTSPSTLNAQPGAAWNFEMKYTFTDAHVPVGAMTGDIALFELDNSPTSLNSKCMDAITAGTPIIIIWNSESCNKAWEIGTSLIGPLIDQHGSNVMWLEVALANEVHQTGSNELNYWADIDGGDTIHHNFLGSQTTPGGFFIPQTEDWNEYSLFQQERAYRLVNSIQCYTQDQMDLIQVLLETADESMADIFGGPSGAAVLNPITKTIVSKIVLPGECNENGQCVEHIFLFNEALNMVQQDLDALVITSDQTISSTGDLNLYPNPSNGIFEMRLGAELVGSQIRVVNDLGQEVWSASAYSNRMSIDLSHLSKGIYSVLLQRSSGPTSAKRIVITK